MLNIHLFELTKFLLTYKGVSIFSHNIVWKNFSGTPFYKNPDFFKEYAAQIGFFITLQFIISREK